MATKQHAAHQMGQQELSFTSFNWRRELLLVSMAGMEVSWLAGWAVVMLGAGRTAGLLTAWLSAFVLYLIAAITARRLSLRRSPRADWIIGGLALVSTLIFVKLNLYPEISVFNPRWFGTFVGQIAGQWKTWPRELTGLFIGFVIWFRGLRLPGRYIGIRPITRHLQLGLAVVVALAIVSTGLGLDVRGVVIAYFVAGLLSLALTRIEETAYAEGGSDSPFGRKWLMTLAAALLMVGVLALMANHILTVETLRTLLRPFAVLAVIVLSAFALVLGILAQYLLIPILARLFSRMPEGFLNFRLPEPMRPEEAEEAIARSLINPAFLDALRVIGLFLLALVALWLVVRSFRRWRIAQTTAGGTRETVASAGSLADDLIGYLRDQWQRLRDLADIRRLLQLRGAGSIRVIYANLLILMAATDHPRRAGQTPYEFEPTAEEVLPTHEPEIRAITDAYVRARYGDEDIGGEELQHLREAWHQVRADGEKLLEEKSVLKP